MDRCGINEFCLGEGRTGMPQAASAVGGFGMLVGVLFRSFRVADALVTSISWNRVCGCLVSFFLPIEMLCFLSKRFCPLSQEWFMWEAVILEPWWESRIVIMCVSYYLGLSKRVVH